MAEAPGRHTKVIKFQILKPLGDLTWEQLGQLLRDVRYMSFRLANHYVSEKYIEFHRLRTGQPQGEKLTIGKLSKQLRTMVLEEEKFSVEGLQRFSRDGAATAYVHDALSNNKLKVVGSNSKWRDVLRGKTALPTFRLTMAIPVRCDQKKNRRLERLPNGDVAVDLLICLKPYPRVLLATKGIGDGATAILGRLLDNPTQDMSGYRQRCFEIKQDETTKKWWLYVTYDFPAAPSGKADSAVGVGVDLGFSCPLYAAISNGHARLGRRQFGALGARIRHLQGQVMSRRRSMLSGGKINLSGESPRSGHGRNRKLAAIASLEGRINRAYTTLNHQLSGAVIRFAKDHGAGFIQVEDLRGLAGELSGTFMGERWRYHQLQEFLAYKAKEAGLEFRKVNPRYTSRRCSECGFIDKDFTRKRRDAESQPGKIARFQCPKCEKEFDPDYNAARNLGTLDIEKKIAEQCKVQKLEYPKLFDNEDEAAAQATLAPRGNREPAAEGRPARPEGL